MKISIYNILGSLQAELLNGTLDPGRHSIDWDASKNSSGIYFIELKTDQFREIKITDTLRILPPWVADKNENGENEKCEQRGVI